MRADVAVAGDWLRKNAAVLLLSLALIGSSALLLSFNSGLAPFQDSWELLMNRRGLTVEAFLQPHNEHIVVIPVAITQLLLHLFGMGSATPESVVLTASLATAAALVFVYARRRVGSWLALMAAVLLLFLGPGWQDLLWSFQVGLVGSLLFGVAMLLALDGDGRRSDLAACVFLAIAVGFSSLGVAFAAGAAVDVLLRRRERGLERAYVVAVPLLLYGGWYLGWGNEAESHLSLHNVLVSPLFVFDGLSASVDSLLGLGTIADEAVARSRWGPVFLLALVSLLVYRQRRGPGVPAGIWPVAATAATFWFLAAFNYIPGREAYSSRYLYPGAAFVLLLGANLMAGIRPGRRLLLAAAAVTLVVASFNAVPLREGRDFLRDQTVLTRSGLAALEISSRTVAPSFALTPEVAGTSFLTEIEAAEYLAAVREFGSPAYTAAELAGAPETARAGADVVLANALPVTIETDAAGSQVAWRRRRCTVVGGAAGAGAPPLSLSSGMVEIELARRGPATIRLRRFARRTYPLVTDGLAGGSTTLLRIPRDRSARPWRLRVEAAQPATVCQ
jgi:hypothetical protein